MPISVSSHIRREIGKFRNHMCDEATQLPCISFGRPSAGRLVGPPVFLLGAVDRQGPDKYRLIRIGGMDVAVILPRAFDLLENMYLDFVEGEIVNIS
jgi:hypothetical protein